MRRETTNKIRYVMDELVPAAIRDSKWFMWPFFALAYKTFSVKRFMDFKKYAYSMTADEYSAFYTSLGNSVSRTRLTDINEKSIQFIVDHINTSDAASLLDVGSGNGYLLSRLDKHQAWQRVAGVDVSHPLPENQRNIEFHTGLLPHLPFADNEFDVVTCTHVIEHLIDVEGSIKELIRVAKNKLFIVIPRQRYYFYTLDEHLNFYPEIEPLTRLLSQHSVEVSTQDGDWAILVKLNKTPCQKP